jgi:hypothetical protein
MDLVAQLGPRQVLEFDSLGRSRKGDLRGDEKKGSGDNRS